MKQAIHVGIILLSATLFAQAPKPSDAAVVKIVGYVRDAGCVYRFREVTKPLPNGCLQACVRAGSPLVILTREEQVYQPISPEIPDKDIRARLLPFAGKLVQVTGHVYERRGSRAITVENIRSVRE